MRLNHGIFRLRYREGYDKIRAGSTRRNNQGQDQYVGDWSSVQGRQQSEARCHIQCVSDIRAKLQYRKECVDRDGTDHRDADGISFEGLSVKLTLEEIREPEYRTLGLRSGENKN